MKPNFALSLSFEGIKLLHRAAGGWREVGEVSVTADDLAGELAMLRKTAASLEPGGVRSKLLIPASQVKYLTIDTAGLSDAARRKSAEAALHDATPYEIDDLAYDISQDGAKTHIAAVARETLAEAEAFAVEHRFHPVSFVAVPDDAPYLGEPFFGPAEGAADLLEPGEVVEPDGIAVVVVGTVAPLVDLPTEAKEPTDAMQDAPAELDATDSVEEPDEPAPVAETREKEPKPETATTSAKTPAEPDTAPAEPEAGLEVTAAEEPAPKPEKPVFAETPEAAPVEDEPETAEAQAPLDLDLKEPEAAAPLKSDAPSPEKSDTAAPVALTPEDVSPARAKALAAAAAVGAPQKPTFSTTKKVVGPATTRSTPDTGFASRRNGASPAAKPLGGAARAPVSVSTPGPDSSSLTQPVPVADKPAQPAKAGFFSRRKPRKGAAAPMPAPTGQVAVAGTEAERMTVFGARADQVGGKPRFLGLVMTVILLVFLAGVAAWAAVFLDEGIAGLIKKDTGRTTASAPENQIDPEIIRSPENAETDTPDAVQIAALDPVLSAEDTAVLDALQDARPEPERPVITVQEAAARYAVTGIWPLAPNATLANPDTISEPVYRSSIDGVSTATDAIALPAPKAFETDTELAAVVSPPPFGQRTAVDAAGLIVPTEQGAVTPGGFTLFAASPPLKPPATLTRFATRPTVAAPVETSPLLEFRPKNRPLGLAERSERAQLGGVTRSELAAYRPSLRPSSIQDRAREAEEEARKADEAAKQNQEARAIAAAQAATAAAAAALAVPQPTEATAPTAIENATKFATAQSKRPDTRPRNFARIVKRAERAAPKETRVAAAAPVAPRTVAPKLPSKASVARSATVKNAINLRKVNLIGVYGKSTSRRALVRLSNGRYQKVRVGDRIDGGRVSAISNSELRYSKGGRNVTLKMP